MAIPTGTPTASETMTADAVNASVIMASFQYPKVPIKTRSTMRPIVADTFRMESHATMPTMMIMAHQGTQRNIRSILSSMIRRVFPITSNTDAK